MLRAVRLTVACTRARACRLFVSRHVLPAVTAQYFLVKLYWKCFFASLWAAVTGRVLFWLYKAATDTDGK